MGKTVTTSELFQKLASTPHRRTMTAEMIFRQLRLGRADFPPLKTTPTAHRTKTSQ